MKDLYYITIILLLFFLLLHPHFAKGQVHEGNALFKNSLRQECYERYGTNPGCGAPLEEWMNLWESIQVCQFRDGFMCARAEAAFNAATGRPDGFNSYSLAACGQGVAQYIVPANIAFQDFDTGWKYPTLTKSIQAHIVAGKATMNNYIASVNFLWMNETFHRMLVGKSPALPLPPPVFTTIN